MRIKGTVGTFQSYAAAKEQAMMYLKLDLIYWCKIIKWNNGWGIKIKGKPQYLPYN